MFGASGTIDAHGKHEGEGGKELLSALLRTGEPIVDAPAQDAQAERGT